MKKQQPSHIFPGIILSLSLLLLLLFPAAATDGAKRGLILWFYQVSPSLLPFFILSGLFLSTGFSDLLAKLLSPVLSPVFRCSTAGCYAIVIGLLSGLPVGAKTVADLVSTGRISKKEGAFLLPLCNNAGPFFLLGYVSVTLLHAPEYSVCFLLIVWISSILSALLLRPDASFSRFRNSVRTTALTGIPSSPATAGSTPSLSFSFGLLDAAIEQSFSLLFRIGGYIVLFSVLAELFTLLPFSPFVIACLCSLLEITTGASALCTLSLKKTVLFPLIGAVVSFGGLSGMAQTKSVLGKAGLPFAHYVFCKLLAAMLAALFLFVLVR